MKLEKNDLATIFDSRMEVKGRTGKFFKDEKGKIFERVTAVEYRLTWAGVDAKSTTAFQEVELDELPAEANLV